MLGPMMSSALSNPSTQPGTSLAILSVVCGGAIGATARFAVELALAGGVASPLLAASLSLLVVNAAGSAGLGWLLGHLERRGGAPWLRPFLGVGVFGAFTTFSGFAAHLRLLHLQAGATATTGFFVASCLTAALLFHAARGAQPETGQDT
jgi:CrcB protein